MKNLNYKNKDIKMTKFNSHKLCRHFFNNFYINCNPIYNIYKF